MLAIEKQEKKVALERLEAIQIYYRSRLANNDIDNVDNPPIPAIKDQEIHVELEAYEAMNSAIKNFQIDYHTLKDSITLAFNDENGKQIHTMSPHEFVRKLYNSSQKISKSEANYLSHKFYDGNGVRISHFLNFFEDDFSATPLIPVKLKELKEDKGDAKSDDKSDEFGNNNHADNEQSEKDNEQYNKNSDQTQQIEQQIEDHNDDDSKDVTTTATAAATASNAAIINNDDNIKLDVKADDSIKVDVKADDNIKLDVKADDNTVPPPKPQKRSSTSE